MLLGGKTDEIFHNTFVWSLVMACHVNVMGAKLTFLFSVLKLWKDCSAVTICQILFPIDKRYDKSKLSQ